MAGYMHDSGYNQRRVMAFGAIVALHVIIAWAFITGFGQAMVAQIVKDVQVSIIKPDEVKETPPPPPKPNLDKPPPVSVPPPLVNITIPIEAPPMVVTAQPPPPRPIAVVASTAVVTVQVPDCKEDYYPSQAIRLNQEGTVVVKLCVGVNNKIDRPVELITSSGFPLLDEAAGKCMAAGRYKAGTIEGKPAPTCKSYRVKFQVKE
ncbi:MAG TPA: TonB family protein [Steroidobacteraceae bacterium]|nr:TonB family protein [Steroidobacteraceae bacterium]